MTHPVDAPVKRNFIGYGASPPRPDWPENARLAVNFVMNYEEGGEPSFMDGDGRTEFGLTETAFSPVPVGQRDLAAESMFEYGSRVGFWRIMRLFAQRNLPMTIFACALALERNAEAAAAIRESGHDICCHGRRWVEHFKLSRDEERREIDRAVESLRGTTGAAPEVWYCRYGPSVHTRGLLVEKGGFLYDSDAYNDELPYWVLKNGAPHLVVPYSLATNDTKFARGSIATSGQFFDYLRDAFDVLYGEGAEHPKMMSIGLHMRIVGHPARIGGLARFVDYVRGHSNVWICRRVEIARHWRATFPYVGGIEHLDG